MPLNLQQLARPEQRMVLSPQMQQAIFLLQVPLLELRTIIQQEMIQNPLLEEVLEQVKPDPDSVEAVSADSAPEELEFEAEIDRLAEMDEEWKEYFFQDHSDTTGRYQAPDKETQRFLEESITSKESLTEYLLSQLNISPATGREKEISRLIIGAIDANGYLTETLEAIARQGGIGIDEAEAALSLVHTFHPPGVGARDLTECLLLQVRSRSHPDPLAAEIIRHHLEDLGGRRYPQIAQALSTTPERVQRAAEFIATLNPKPGMICDRDLTTYVTPDLFLEKNEEDKYQIVFNRDYNPRLRISRRYRQLLVNPATPEKTREYIREKLRAGLWLIRNIGLRRQTLRQITEEIVRRQKDFFDRGLTHLRPLRMTEVAEKVGIHESTVSRAVANKYLQSPRGVLPLRYFFTGSTTTEGGKEISAPHLKKILEEMIGEEDPREPYSDQELAELLAGRGIKLARRTVAKYRNDLQIPPVHRRKSWPMRGKKSSRRPVASSSI